MRESDSSSAKIRVVPATVEQKPVLANLLELYMHDFCDFLHVQLRPDGRFGYKDLDLYWTDAVRYPFLVYLGDQLAGFALVKAVGHESADAKTWDMAEFFILRSYRRHGIGRQVAHQVFRRFQGSWQVRVMEANHAARSFWAGAVSTFAAEVHSQWAERSEASWRVFTFHSEPERE